MARLPGSCLLQLWQSLPVENIDTLDQTLLYTNDSPQKRKSLQTTHMVSKAKLLEEDSTGSTSRGFSCGLGYLQLPFTWDSA